MSYIYDAQGRRVQKTVNGTVSNYFYSGGTLLARKEGSAWRDYIHFGGKRVAWIADATDGALLHTDHLGSVRVCTLSGNVLGTCEYEPFGEAQPGSSCSLPINYRFAGPALSEGSESNGMEWDPETDLYHTWFRQYDPKQGRWTSVDPLAGSADSPQSLNRYAYVVNDPINLFDPLGLTHERKYVCRWDPGKEAMVCKWEEKPHSSANPAGVEGGCFIAGTNISVPCGVGWFMGLWSGDPDSEKLARLLDRLGDIDSLGFGANFSAGAGDTLTGFCGWLTSGWRSCTQVIRDPLGTGDVVDETSTAYGVGEIAGDTVVYTLGATGGATALAVHGGKFGPLFGRGGPVRGGFFNRGNVRFGWYWTGTRDAIGFRVGPKGSFHLPFWYP